MAEFLNGLKLLIVEDGDEYYNSLSGLISGPSYLQVHNGTEAIELLENQTVELIFLDMRFDRIPRSQLLGKPADLPGNLATSDARAWKFIENNQGLYILDAIRGAGHEQPALVSYDFSSEQRRWRALTQQHKHIAWLPDGAGLDVIVQTIKSFI